MIIRQPDDREGRQCAGLLLILENWQPIIYPVLVWNTGVEARVMRIEDRTCRGFRAGFGVRGWLDGGGVSRSLAFQILRVGVPVRPAVIPVDALRAAPFAIELYAETFRDCCVPQITVLGDDHTVIAVSTRITANPVRGLAFVCISRDPGNDPRMPVRRLTGRSVHVVQCRETL